MFEAKVVWYRRTRTVLLSVWCCDYVETSCRDDIKIFKWIASSLITYSRIWHSDVSKLSKKKRKEKGWLTILKTLENCENVFWQCHISGKTMVELYVLYYNYKLHNYK